MEKKMLTEVFYLHEKGSLADARLCTYILDDSDSIAIAKRPMMLICPGGGYEHTSDREAEPLAMHFLSIGYHVAVLRYSVAPAVYPTALLEATASMKLIHEHAKEWYVDTDKIVVQGSSAGGHLAACLAMFWHTKWLAEMAGVTNDILKPAAMLLNYPVITSGEYAHRGSFKQLLGGNETEEMLELLSLEKQVTEYTPPAFIWHTYTDQSVPVQNSLLLIEAMKKYEIPVEFHMYPVGKHGLSTCSRLTAMRDGTGIQQECGSWLLLAKRWLIALRDE